LPGQFSTKGARLNARRPMRWRPKLLNPRAVLTPIKAWPGNLEQAASQVQRPALTVAARGAPHIPAGRDEGTITRRKQRNSARQGGY
jgi:hypothetical protein